MIYHYMIVEGDTTTHGGKVLVSQTLLTINRKKIAFVGDLVFCPKCKGLYVIKPIKQITTYMGKSIAVEGMETACGARLIASQKISKL